MNNNSNHNTIWILGLIVVLVLGVLIGTNLKKPSGVASEQQGAVAKATNTTITSLEKQMVGGSDQVFWYGCYTSSGEFNGNYGFDRFMGNTYTFQEDNVTYYCSLLSSKVNSPNLDTNSKISKVNPNTILEIINNWSISSKEKYDCVNSVTGASSILWIELETPPGYPAFFQITSPFSQSVWNCDLS